MASATATGKGAGRSALNMVLFYAFLVLFVLASVFPLLWVTKMSIVTKSELYATPPTILPHDLTGAEWAQVLGDSTFQKALINSAIIASSTTIICLFFGSIAAYAISRLRFRFKSTVMTLILAISFFPPVAIIAPLFIQYTQLALIDTYWSVIITDTVFALPLTIWLLVAFFRELPVDLEDAAKVDGATTIQAFRKVIVPLAAPGVFTAAILVFIFAWNDFIFANTLTSTDNARTVPAALAFFTGASQFEQPIGAISAAAVVVTVPIIIMVLIFQRRIVAGLTAGAVKG
jgi:multiple sugar transport system permease protein